MVEADLKAENSHEHWSQYLRCTICFNYLKDPHTLECGHTFCKKCLKRLAQIAKEDSPGVRLRKLGLSCPTCRHSFPAKPSLKGRIPTNIVLKHMVELWAKESQLFKNTAVVKLRSVTSQTEVDNVQAEGGQERQSVESEEPQEEVFTERTRPLEQYLESVLKTVLEYADEFEQDCIESNKCRITPVNDSISEPSETDTSSSSSNDNSRVDTHQSYSNISLNDVFSHFTIPGFSLSYSNAGRYLIMLIWCTYCVIIVGLAEVFLPYILIFTLFFFLLVLG